MSEHRIDYAAFKPGLDNLFRLGKAVHASSLEPSLIELVNLRVSQINECAFCLDMHWKDARAQGETEQRLYGLSAWREASYYTDRERAALALTEAVTRLAGGGGVPDEVIAAAEPHFSAEELAALMYAIVLINAWNRLAVSGRSVAGSYVVGAY